MTSCHCYDADNAITTLARQCNAECQAATAGAKPSQYPTLTQPIIDKFAHKASLYGLSRQRLKYRMGVLNGVFSEKG